MSVYFRISERVRESVSAERFGEKIYCITSDSWWAMTLNKSLSEGLSPITSVPHNDSRKHEETSDSTIYCVFSSLECLLLTAYLDVAVPMKN